MMITSFIFAMLTLSVSAGPWLYMDQNVGSYGPTIPFPYGQYKVKLRGSQTNNLLGRVEMEILHGDPGYHYHTREDECFHVLEGQAQFVINGTQFCVKTGDYIYIPRYASQTFRVQNPTFKKKRTRLEVSMFPAGIEGFFDDAAIVFLQGQINSTAANDRIAKKYGLIFQDQVDWQDLGCFDDDNN